MRFLLALFIAGTLSGQCVAVKKTTGLSSSTEKVTIQQPATPTKRIRGLEASISCSVACEVIVTRDGSTATTTALTLQKLSSGDPACTFAEAFSSSNSTGGTEISRHSVPASSILVLDLKDLQLDKTAGANFSIGTSSITGDVFVNIKVSE